MDCSPPGSSVHGISQARILYWVAISFSGGSLRSRDQTHISHIGWWVLYDQATFNLKKSNNIICIYYSAIKKNIFESVLMRWIKLEPIIQSEVSQKDKHQYSILKHISGI